MCPILAKPRWDRTMPALQYQGKFLGYGRINLPSSQSDMRCHRQSAFRMFSHDNQIRKYWPTLNTGRHIDTNEMASRSIAAKPSPHERECPHEDIPPLRKVYRPTSFSNASGYRSPCTSMPEKALSISSRSASRISTSVAPRFSSRR